jgi:hypothetical protein
MTILKRKPRVGRTVRDPRAEDTMTQSAENHAPRPTCGHTTRPCTDTRTWCPDCGTPPCCHHLTTCAIPPGERGAK